MHVLLGVEVQFLLAFMLRTSVASLWPWLIVVLLELANEWNDFRVDRWPESAMQLGEGAKDLVLTMILLTLLLLLARRYPRVLQRKR